VNVDDLAKLLVAVNSWAPAFLAEHIARWARIEAAGRAFLTVCDDVAWTYDDSPERVDRYYAAAGALRQALAATVGGPQPSPSPGGAGPTAGK
jgi:hypothetical protein